MTFENKFTYLYTRRCSESERLSSRNKIESIALMCPDKGSGSLLLETFPSIDCTIVAISSTERGEQRGMGTSWSGLVRNSRRAPLFLPLSRYQHSKTVEFKYPNKYEGWIFASLGTIIVQSDE